jgi:hypothetical protein
MFRGDSTSTCLAIILAMLFLAPIMSLSAEQPKNPTFEFDQADGIRYLNVINISGFSSVPLNSIEISLWNVTADGQYELLNSSSSLLSVTPFETELGVTNWNWNHEFDHTSESCTCLVRISLLEQTDLVSFGLTIFLGTDNHRPVLMYHSNSDQTSQVMLATENVTLNYGLLLPPNLLSFGSLTANHDVLTSFSVCPAPFGVCTGEYISLTVLHELSNKDFEITLDTHAINLPDGLYLIDLSVQTMSLKDSNSIMQYLAVDRNPPNVSVSSVSEILESQSITVDLNVDDGYDGSVYSITWTIIEPDGELRAVSSSEILSDNRLSFAADEQGVYQIFGLVRDTGGNFVNIQHDVNVINVKPELDLRFDGFKIQNDQIITVKSADEWCFSANQTTDTSNDIDSLKYDWFVDGKTLLSGRSYLLSSDIKAEDWEEITLTLTDNNGANSSITFTVEEQESSEQSSIRSFTIWTTLLLILVLSIIVLIRKKYLSQHESDFVRWSDKKTFDD